ncbi:MAG TPA: LytTR family DNA-binding domain-containing protein [Steroidobacteraceae bacterium]|nr:LytTR family DNA-binding domain-containing protein [Steroidobacteraceae bacterium]
MTTPTAIIAEDEPVIQRELRAILTELWPQLQIVAEVDNGTAALAAIEEFRPKVIFLDIQMPGASGLEVAQQVNGRAHVVFVTAFDNYAVAAFEKGALDYVLKPVSASRMQSTIERLRSRLNEPPADLGRIAELLKEITPRGSRYLKWLTVPAGEELRVIAVSEISYLEADRKYTTVVTPAGSFLMNSSLRQLKEKLDPDLFWQIHRSVIVNVGAIDRIYRTFRGSLELKLKERGELLPVSASHAHLFREVP